MQHLGAVIENHVYKEKCVTELVTNLNNQLQLLSEIAETSHNQHMHHLLVVLKVKWHVSFVPFLILMNYYFH